MKIINVPNRRMRHVEARTDKIIEACTTFSEKMVGASTFEPKARWYFNQQQGRLARLYPWAFKGVVPAKPYHPPHRFYVPALALVAKRKRQRGPDYPKEDLRAFFKSVVACNMSVR